MMNTLLAVMALTMGGDVETPAPQVVTDGTTATDETPSEVLSGEAATEGKSTEGANEEPGAALPAQVVAFLADQIYLGDGRMLEEGVVIVTDGVITKVGQGLAVPAGASVIEHEGAISPGLIALHSNDGALGELLDSTRAVLPQAEARFAFRPEHLDFERACAAGITSLVLVPSPATLVGGQAVVVKTHGGQVVKAGTQLALGFSSAALNRNKFPTSYDGALGEFERLFTSAEGPIGKAAGGNLPVLMAVGDRAEILRATAFAGKHGLKGALYGSYWAEEVVSAIQESGLAVVCGPFDAGEGSRAIRSVVALAKAGVKFGFGLDAPARHPASLRFGAALCVRGGLEPAAARRALTGDAAQIAGVSARIGRISRGLDADLVLWSGDPVDLTSSIDAVYIDGKRVVGGEK